MTITDPQKARSITLTEGAWSALDTASPDIIKTLQDVHVVMHRLSCEKDLDQPTVNSTLRLAARAVRRMEDKEVHALERLDHVIRHANPGSLANRGGPP